MPPNLIEAPATAPALPTQQRPTFTALVVDDHPLIRESVAVPLHSLGASEVVEAASCVEAPVRPASYRRPGAGRGRRRRLGVATLSAAKKAR